MFDKPDSTYDPTGTTGTPQKKDDSPKPTKGIVAAKKKSEPKPKPKPKPKRDDSNDSPISMPTPRPKSPSGVKAAQKKGKGYVGGFGF